ncbi:MAG: 2-amino-4-hydroxy-6-hydroxymethyldihydropteridine diphosphokinase [Castellaniella sp.]
MSRAYVGLGANLGDMQASLNSALQALDALPQTRVEAVSSRYASAPVGAEGPDYLNAVARLETGLAPLALLDALQAVETAHGRRRPYPNAPRSLDLDLLLYDDIHLDTARLILPHPRMHERAFVLLPLLELDAALHLTQGEPAQLLAACADQRIRRLADPRPAPAPAARAQ